MEYPRKKRKISQIFGKSSWEMDSAFKREGVAKNVCKIE